MVSGARNVDSSPTAGDMRGELLIAGRVEPGDASGRGRLERRWWTLIIVCVAIFMLLLDITIVNVALPSIAYSLHASFSEIQWVINAYALTLAALLLSAGTLADLLGRRRVFTIGLGLFSATSLLCALAPSALFLVLARGGQGIGGAIMFATSLALLAQEFHGAERATALAIWGASTGAAVAAGPLLGGILTEALGWQWIFLINVPIAVAAAALTLTRVRETRDPAAPGIDWLGTLTFTGALFLLVLALIRGDADGWTSPLVLAGLGAGAALLVAFVVAEAAQRHPMLDLSLFAKPSFTGASVAAFALSASMFSIFLFLTLYLQTILGLSPLQTGLRFLPITAVMFVVSAGAGSLTDRVPIRVLLGAGLGLVGVGLLLMRGLTATSHWSALLAGFLVAGAGIGLVNPALAAAAIGVVRPERSGMASGINSTFRQVGIAAGIAALGAIFQSQLAATLAPRLGRSPAAGHSTQIAHAVASGGAQSILRAVPAGQRTHATTAIHAAFAGAMNDILMLAALVAFAGATIALALVKRSDLSDLAAEPSATSVHAAA